MATSEARVSGQFRAPYTFPLGSEKIDALKRSAVIYYPPAFPTVSSEDI